MVRPRWLASAVVLALNTCLDSSAAGPRTTPQFSVLVFSKTAGYRHASIPNGIALIQALGAGHQFAVDASEDAAVFNDANLTRYRAVIFLNTTGDILDTLQQQALRRYIGADRDRDGHRARARQRRCNPRCDNRLLRYAGPLEFASAPHSNLVAVSILGARARGDGRGWWRAPVSHSAAHREVVAP